MFLIVADVVFLSYLNFSNNFTNGECDVAWLASDSLLKSLRNRRLNFFKTYEYLENWAYNIDSDPTQYASREIWQ